MSNNYEKFVIESIKSHQQTLTEQIRISEDVNRYSTWFLGLSTAGVGLLIARFESISVKSWVGAENIKIYLITVGILLFISIIFGILHQNYSIKERNCSRIHIANLRKLRLFLISDLPGFSKEEISDDLDNRILRGQLFGDIKIPNFEVTISQAEKLRKLLTRILTTQQIFSAVSYIIFFVLSITK